MYKLISTPQSRGLLVRSLPPFDQTFKLHVVYVLAHEDPLGISHFCGPPACKNIPYPPPPTFLSTPPLPASGCVKWASSGPNSTCQVWSWMGLWRLSSPWWLWSLSWVEWGDITLLSSPRIYVKEKRKKKKTEVEKWPDAWFARDRFLCRGEYSSYFREEDIHRGISPLTFSNVLHDSLHIHLIRHTVLSGCLIRLVSPPTLRNTNLRTQGIVT